MAKMVGIPNIPYYVLLLGMNMIFSGSPLVDLLQRENEDPPEVGKKVLCRHPFQVGMTTLFL
jgi:hypothetical protein